jgi:ferric-dicitrate binding protein FerR (iron transport regulator)
VCHGTPLWRLTAVLNEAFNAKIRIENKEAANLRLETTFHDESLDDILNVIAATFKLTIEKRGEEIIIK